jgi:hypothetical protein
VEAGWTAVTKRVKLDADIQQKKLQIKTSAAKEKGNNYKEINLYFYGDGWLMAGGLIVKFSSPMTYWISYCKGEYFAFPTAPLTDQNKVWSILRTKSVLTVKCNGVVVLEYDTSVCDQNKWGREIKKIKFYTSDKASEEYRIVSPGT